MKEINIAYRPMSAEERTNYLKTKGELSDVAAAKLIANIRNAHLKKRKE